MERTCDRRRFLGAAAMTMVATQLGIRGTADAQSSQGGSAGAPLIPPGTSPRGACRTGWPRHTTT